MTTTLARRILVRSPHAIVVAALPRLTEASAERPPYVLSLRAPVRLASLDAEVVMHGATIVDLSSPVRAGDGIGVNWRPARGGFPSFDGRLWPEAETLCTSWLRLEGTYTTGDDEHFALRDERAIGYRVALALARQFLDDMATTIEALPVPRRLQRP